MPAGAGWAAYSRRTVRMSIGKPVSASSGPLPPKGALLQPRSSNGGESTRSRFASALADADRAFKFGRTSSNGVARSASPRVVAQRIERVASAEPIRRARDIRRRRNDPAVAANEVDVSPLVVEMRDYVEGRRSYPTHDRAPTPFRSRLRACRVRDTARRSEGVAVPPRHRVWGRSANTSPRRRLRDRDVLV